MSRKKNPEVRSQEPEPKETVSSLERAELNAKHAESRIEMVLAARVVASSTNPRKAIEAQIKRMGKA